MIIRKKNKSDYTVVANKLISDDSLDWRDLGLLVYLLSKPEHWTVSVAHLAKQRKSGRDAVYSILHRLNAAGYASYQKHANGTTDWTITEDPNPENTDQATSEPNTENTDQEKPNTEKPDQEKPDQANPTLVSNETTVSNELEKRKEKEKNLPTNLNTVAWAEYVAYRKEIKAKKYTEKGEALKTKWLTNQGDNKAQQSIVDQTIENGWTGLFELKNRSNHETSDPTSAKPTTDPHLDTYKKYAAGEFTTTDEGQLDSCDLHEDAVEVRT